MAAAISISHFSEKGKHKGRCAHKLGAESLSLGGNDMRPVHFFLGANSGEGFYSLYDQLLGGRLDDLMILKGGPGCGKSTFMRRVGAEAERRGERVIYIQCSGDPDSLDAVILPDRKTAAVDGTSPHVLEPTYTAACERYVDLTRFYDVAAAKVRRAEIVALSDEYRAHYRSAYRILRALDEVTLERRVALHAQMDFSKLRRRMNGILARELRGEGTGTGRVDRAFLGGVTHRGDICRFDTVETLCPRVYELDDSAGLGAEVLESIVQTAREKQFDVVACPDPDRPRELQHVLIPERGLAFVTANARIPYEGRPYRRLRLDAMAEDKLTRAQKAKLRFARRVEASLLDEAVAALASAKRAHDALESAYHPCVDFAGVTALADEEIERSLKQ